MLLKKQETNMAGIVSEGVEAGDVEDFIDTGSHVFNGLLSGSLYGGLPQNKITAIWLVEKVQQEKLSFSWVWSKTF